MQFDNILDRIGGFGKYQCGQYFLAGLSFIPVALHMLVNVFAAAVPPHWCYVPQLDAFNLTLEEREILTSPAGNSEDIDASCWMYNISYSTLDIQSVLQNNTILNASQVVSCSSWQYDHTRFAYTIVEQWDLVCSQSWKRAMASSVFMAGFLAGSLIFGLLSDRYGRRFTWLACTVLLFTSGIIAPFIRHYWLHVCCRFVTAMAVSGTTTTAFVICMEIIGRSQRMIPGVFYHQFFAAGVMLLCPLAYGLNDFRWLMLTIDLLTILYIPYWWLFKESPRWLISQGKMKKGRVLVELMAKTNNKNPPEQIVALTETPTKNVTLEAHITKRYTIIDLFRTPNMRRNTICLCINWAVISLVYYGLSFGVSNLSGNPYLNLFLSGALETPSYFVAVLTLDRIGRRIPHVAMMLIGGLACSIMPAIPHSMNWFRISLAMTGKMCISGAFSIIYVFSAEIFPTCVRTIGIGAGSVCARVGGLVAPFIADLGSLVGWPALPMLIFGGTSISAGLFTLFLPETLGQRLPETLEDGENFVCKRDRGRCLTANQHGQCIRCCMSIRENDVSGDNVSC